MLNVLSKVVEEAGGARAFARVSGINQSHITRALNGDASVGPALLAAAGLERVVAYRRTPTPTGAAR